MKLFCRIRAWLRPCFLHGSQAVSAYTNGLPSRDAWQIRKRLAGFTVVEVAVSVTILALFGIGAIEALFTLNRNAASARVITVAREVVQRNMEAAMTVPFDSTNIPPILALNGGIGWNETADVALNSVEIPLLTARDGTVIVNGTLKRTVVALTGTGYNTSTRRVTFTLDYTLNGKAKPGYSLTSIRSPDI